MKVKISTDSTCDLPREFVERYDIGVLPLYIIRDGVSLKASTSRHRTCTNTPSAPASCAAPQP